MKQKPSPFSVEVFIETPRGSAHKYAYDQDSCQMKLKKILPAGMVFPFDFGFFPGTKGEDGDPLDAIVISSFQTYPGTIVDCRIIGAIEAKQGKDKKIVRNDRYLAIPTEAALLSNIHSAEDLPEPILNELEQFFINYNALEKKTFKVLRVIKARDAAERICSNREIAT